MYLVALIVWIGTIVFFSFVAAPAIFGSLAPQDAGRVASAIFRTYYRLGYACGVILLVMAALLWRDAGARRSWAAGMLLIAVMLALTLYAGLAVQPRASALRPQLYEEATAGTARPEFDHLHRLAVQLNGAVLLCGLVVTVLTARSLKP